jgi:hypothetical protein
LHSHTLHSKESLNFMYHVSRKSAVLRAVLKRGEARYRAIHGSDLDLNRGWWTPPLAPLDALHLESSQLEELNLSPIVSLTDHDDIEAGMSLQAMDASRKIPISVEWTVPFGPTFFHLGIHNILPQHARMVMRCLEAYTADPNPAMLCSLMADLDSAPASLIVFNHPLWDEKGVGADVHRATAIEFLRRHGEFIHAIEINGLRPWPENQVAIHFAAAWNKPVISGGDRHTIEPNAMINVTNASTFAEFVHEIRRDQHSEVVILQHYHQAHASRIFHNMVDVFRTYEDHGRGWKDWADRVFFTIDSGEIKSLTQIWGETPPSAVAIFAGLMRLADRSPMRPVRRATLRGTVRI